MIIKVCGIMTPEDANAALRSGADWIGLNFVSGPRKIDHAAGLRILECLSRPDAVVALLTSSALEKAPFDPASLVRLGVRRVQVYGEPTPDVIGACAAEGVAWIPVHHVPPPASAAQSRTDADRAALASALGVAAQRARNEGAGHLIVDAAAFTLGGSGVVADWSILQMARQAGMLSAAPPVILAGGLNPANVAEAIQACWPAGVDVSSGVETAPGRKDENRMQAFIRAARSAAVS